MRVIKTRQLIEAERLLGLQPAPFNVPGFAYVTSETVELRALSVDGVCGLIRNYPLEVVFSSFGALGGCFSRSEKDALVEVEKSVKK